MCTLIVEIGSSRLCNVEIRFLSAAMDSPYISVAWAMLGSWQLFRRFEPQSLTSSLSSSSWWSSYFSLMGHSQTYATKVKTSEGHTIVFGIPNQLVIPHCKQFPSAVFGMLILQSQRKTFAWSTCTATCQITKTVDSCWPDAHRAWCEKASPGSVSMSRT